MRRLDMLGGMWMFVIGAVAVVAFVYAGVPMIIRQKVSFNARPELRPADLEQVPPALRGLVQQMQADLTDLGFIEMGWLIMSDYVPDVASILDLWIHPEHNTAAAVTVIHPAESTAMTPSVYVEFGTDLASGMDVQTNNARDLTPYPPRSERHLVTSPILKEVPTLYMLHRHVVATVAQGASIKPLPLDMSPAKFVYESVDLTHGHGVNVGYLRFSEATGRYRPTWRGAYLMTWKSLWPMKHVLRAREDRRVRRLMREFGMEPSGAVVLEE